MSVNKFKILQPRLTDKEINLPIEMTWDFLDRSNDIEVYEEKVIKDVINQDKDFEVTRFSFVAPVGIEKSDINYEFNFVPAGATSTTTIWSPSYVVQGFTPKEIYYFANSFKKSFFKLDFYDSTNQKEQTNYITIIIPTQQGATTATTVGTSVKNIKTPVFKLDFLGDLEGYFIYWLKKRDFLDVREFYMTAKFFDGKNGFFVKMMNRPQSILTGINKFNFPQELYFYYKVILDYTNYTYKVYDINNPNIPPIQIGDSSLPIKWYEYINP